MKNGTEILKDLYNRLAARSELLEGVPLGEDFRIFSPMKDGFEKSLWVRFRSMKVSHRTTFLEFYNPADREGLLVGDPDKVIFALKVDDSIDPKSIFMAVQLSSQSPYYKLNEPWVMALLLVAFEVIAQQDAGQ